MIAIVGLPGGSDHDFVRVANRAEAEQFFAEWATAQGEMDLAAQSAYRQSAVLSERDAKRSRYFDGSRVYDNAKTLAEWRREREAIAAQEDAQRATCWGPRTCDGAHGGPCQNSEVRP